MSKQLRNGIIAGAVIVVTSFILGALGDTTLSSTAVSVGLGAFVWYFLQNVAGNRTVKSVPDAERNRLLAEPVPAGQAVLYILREGIRGALVGWEVELDEHKLAQLKSPRFTRVVVAAGEHTLKVNPPGFAGTQTKAANSTVTLAAGEVAVFSLHTSTGMLQNQIQFRRENDTAAAIARLGSITMVAPETVLPGAPPPPVV